MSSNVDFANQAPGAEGYNEQHPAAAHLKTIDKEKSLVDIGDRKKIAICGFASSTRHLIPTDDPTWIIAGLNQLYRHMPRADVWYDIHLNWEQDNVDGTDHEGWIKNCGIPVFMSNPPANFPTSVRYPVERLIQKHGIDYFTSTVSFMLGWAIDCIDRKVADTKDNYSDYTIGVFGIDLIVGTEYDVQKACVEYWLGVAEGRGIQVALPPQSALLKQAYRYGYEKAPETGIIGLLEIQKRAAELQDTKEKLVPVMHGLNGGIQMLRDLKTKASEANEKKTIAELLEMGITEANTKLEQAVAQVQTYDGAYQECVHHVNVMELRVRGGVVPLLQS
jgi:hypothetical protein